MTLGKRFKDEFLNLNSDIIDIIDNLYQAQISAERGVYRGNWKYRAEIAPCPFSVSVLDDPNDEFLTSDTPLNYIQEIPFHIAYKTEYKELKSAILKAIEALELWSKDSEPLMTLSILNWWIKYYKVIISALENDSWEQVEVHFLSWPEDSPYILSIGPIECYSDSKYGVKKYFSAMLLEKCNLESTKLLSKAWDDCRKASALWDGITLRPHFPVDARLFVGIRHKHGGEISRLNIRGWSRPQDVKLSEKHGSLKIIVRNECEDNVEKYREASKGLLQKCGVSGTILNDFLESYPWMFKLYVLLHEYGHTYLHSPGSDKRLGPLYQPFEESRADSNTLLMTTRLESSGDLPKGSTWRMFLMVMSLIRFRYEYSHEQGIGSQYVFAISAIFSAVESHQALRWDEGSVLINVPELFERACDIARENAAYYNSLVRFASSKSELVWETYKTAKAYEKTLLAALFSDDEELKDIDRLTESEKLSLSIAKKKAELKEKRSLNCK